MCVSVCAMVVPRHHYQQANSNDYKLNQRFVLSDKSYEGVDEQSVKNHHLAALSSGSETP